MAEIGRYSVTHKVAEGNSSRVFRGLDKHGGRPVVLKMLKQDYPSPAEVARARQEYEIIRKLDTPKVIGAYEQFVYDKTIVTVLEDTGGDSLVHLAEREPFAVVELLELFAKVAEGLAEIHDRGVIHRDVTPSNIVYNRSNGEIRLIDFGISTELQRQCVPLVSPGRLEGTLAYIAPEQTGRMNRHVDTRADLYSLGMSLYELLCGERAFTTNDPMELIHAHLAQRPTPPHELSADVPEAVSRIVMRLLSKQAEDRYGDGWSVAADLGACAADMRGGRLPRLPEPTQRVRPSRLDIPQKLYGRDAEVDQLLSLFGRGCRGAVSLVFVSGYSGVGKTSLVQELFMPVTLAGGHYCAGKFDQLQSIPYWALTQAFSSLVRQLLTSNASQLEGWRRGLDSALRPDAQVVIDLVPELELLIGPQAPAEPLGPLETNLRLQRLMLRFLAVLSRAEHPLVLFIDDLQWADQLSLSVLDSIARSDELDHLLVIAAYRDNEVDALHRVSTLREALRSSGRDIHELHLRPLADHDIKRLLVETLHQTDEAVAPLVELIAEKSGGNPFFITQLLQSMVAGRQLECVGGAWRWDSRAIAALDHSDNVVDLVLGNLLRLPSDTQQALRHAACLGNEFDIETLAIILGQTKLATYEQLHPAAKAGFILPTGPLVPVEAERSQVPALLCPAYRFLHDRVQQAAYALIPGSERARLHLQIGCLLVDRIPAGERDGRLFEIVAHFGKGERPHEPARRRQVALLNFEAGKRAKQAAAFEASRTYARQALELLPEPMWADEHATAMEIMTMLVAVESICGAYETAERIAQEALPRAETRSQRVALHRILIDQRTILAQYEAALELGLETLAELGLELPRENLGEAFINEHQRLMQRIGEREIASLLDEPRCSDPDTQQMLGILAETLAVMYQTQPGLLAVACARLLNLSLDHGFDTHCANGYTAYGIIMVVALREYELAHEFGRLGLRMAERDDNRTQLCRATQTHMSYINHWTQPLSGQDPLVMRGFQAGLEVGEHQYASYLIVHHVLNCYVRGDSLAEVGESLEKALVFVRKTKNDISLLQALGLKFIIGNLRGHTDAASSFVVDGHDPETMISRASELGMNLPIVQFYIGKAQALFYHGHHAQCREQLVRARPLLPFMPGKSQVADFYLLAALSGLAQLDDDELDVDERERVRAEADSDITQLEEFSTHCPSNFGHYHMLALAERERVLGRPWEALELYDRALTSAAEQGFVQIEALTNLLAAQFWFKRGKSRIGGAYLADAHQGFRSWGANRVAERLEREYPHMLTFKEERLAEATITSTTNFINRELDINSVIQATRALASTTELDSLLTEVMSVGLRCAGAERGLLVVDRSGSLLVKARGVSDGEMRVELLSVALADYDDVCQAIIHYVARKGEAVVLDDAGTSELFAADRYIREQSVRSLIALPLLYQGSLSAIVLMEHRNAAGMFTQDHLALLELILTPAALAIEHALVSEADTDEFEYQVGGTLRDGSPSYVNRRADRDLLHALRAGELSYVLCARQMGKSSMRVRTMRVLAGDGRICAGLDLSLIGGRQVDAERWYAGVARGVLTGLGLGQAVDLRRWWQANDHLTPVQRLFELFDREILERIDSDIVIFIDEIDSVLSLDFSADDFFAMIRGLCNRRADDDRYRRLSFALFGVLSATDLIEDAERTPFNIGRRIQVSNFTLSECKPLMRGLPSKYDPERVMRAVLAWTGGQPFLTQRICQLLRRLETRPLPGRESTWVGSSIRAHVIDGWESKDEPIHLRSVRERVIRSSRREALVELYRTVLAVPEGLESTGGRIESELLMTGLVSQRDRRLYVSNRIYAELFTPDTLRGP